MQAEERQKWIAQYLAKVEFASLQELAQRLSTSPSTVRRDLNLMERSGFLRRTHGGACLVTSRSDDYIFSQRETIQQSEKEKIGIICASLIQPGQSVIVDAGTTVFQAARHLEGKAHQLITNSLPVAGIFASSQNVEVIVSGGVIYPRLGVLVGPLAVDTFSNMHADVAIMSGGGITLEGVTNSHALLIDIQRAMIESASKVIFCFDHTKIGRRSVAHLCSLESIDTVVTNAGASPEILSGLRSAGVEVLIASESGGLLQENAPQEPEKVDSSPEIQNASRGSSELSGGMTWD